MTSAPRVQVNLQLADDLDPYDLPTSDAVRVWVCAALEGAGNVFSNTQTVTVRFVSEDESAALNGGYRSKDGPTNVLAFPAAVPPLPPEVLAELDERELGDLVLCAAVASREADEQGKALSQHLTHLIVHGTLHLLGYDHMTGPEAEAMEALERKVLDGLGLPDPYAAGDALG